MKQNRLGTNLIIGYVVFVIFFFFANSFSLYWALWRASWPIVKLVSFLPESILAQIRMLGLDGMLIVYVALQAIILYFGGNALEKFSKNKF